MLAKSWALPLAQWTLGSHWHGFYSWPQSVYLTTPRAALFSKPPWPLLLLCCLSFILIVLIADTQVRALSAFLISWLLKDPLPPTPPELHAGVLGALVSNTWVPPSKSSHSRNSHSHAFPVFSKKGSSLRTEAPCFLVATCSIPSPLQLALSTHTLGWLVDAELCPNSMEKN